jgi:TusE/DsrC/DsvC family sulfur relay protein
MTLHCLYRPPIRRARHRVCLKQLAESDDVLLLLGEAVILAADPPALAAWAAPRQPAPKRASCALATTGRRVAEQLAARGGHCAGDAHWEMLHLLRAYYGDYDSSPAMRALVKYCRLQLGDDKGRSIYLLSCSRFPGKNWQQNSGAAQARELSLSDAALGNSAGALRDLFKDKCDAVEARFAEFSPPVALRFPLTTGILPGACRVPYLARRRCTGLRDVRSRGTAHTGSDSGFCAGDQSHSRADAEATRLSAGAQKPAPQTLPA